MMARRWREYRATRQSGRAAGSSICPLRRLPLLLLACLLPLPAWAQVTVSDAWLREAPPGAPALAGYLALHNGGSRPRTLVAVESVDFGQAMLHRSVMAGGVARMEHLPRLTLAPGETVRMAPGGLHLMLMHPRRPLHRGDCIRLTLHFEDGSDLELSLPLLRRPPAEEPHPSCSSNPDGGR